MNGPAVTVQMSFEVIAAAINATLAANASGIFVVEGFQRESHATEEIFEAPHVVAYYGQGDFPKSAGRARQTKQHDMTFAIEIAVAANSTVDLSVLKDPNSSAQARMSALAAMKPAAAAANALWDQVARAVYQILSDPVTMDLGLADASGNSIVANPWIQGMAKGDVASEGEYVLLSGTITYTCRAPEYVAGLDFTLLQPIQSIDTTVKTTENPSYDGSTPLPISSPAAGGNSGPQGP